MRQRVEERGAAGIFARVVARRPVAHRHRTVDYRVARLIALEKRRHVDEGFERRTGLAHRVGCAVELADLVIGAADDGPHRTICGHDHHGALGEVVGLAGGGHLLVDDGLRGCLQRQVYRGLHLEHIVAGDALLVDQRHGVAIGEVEEPVGAVGNPLLDGTGGFAPCLQQLALGDEARVQHAIEHGVGARPREIEVLVRGVFGGRLEQARQHGGLRQGDVTHRLAEIELRGRLDAIGTAAEVGTVEIELEDLLLGEAGLDPDRQEGLVHLAADGALGAEEQVLRHLLGERGAALHHVIGARVLDDGAEGADHVDAEMVEEARILGGQHRLDHVRWNVGQGNGVVLADAAAADDFAIGRGEGHGIFAAAVPHVAGTGEGRQGIGEQQEAEDHPESQAVVEEVDEDALHAPEAETLQEAAVGRMRPLEEVPRLEHGGTDDTVSPPESAGQGFMRWDFRHASDRPRGLPPVRGRL